MPDAKDISMDQISSEPTLCGHTVTLYTLFDVLFSVGESLGDPELFSEAETVEIAPHTTLLSSQNGDTATSDIPSQQPATDEDELLSSPLEKTAIPETEGETKKRRENENQSEKMEEGEGGATPKTPVKEPPKSMPLPVALFGSHVEKNHTNNNELFKTEFEVNLYNTQSSADILVYKLLNMYTMCRHWEMVKGYPSL